MALLSQANYAQIPADSSMAFDATTTKSFGFTANANDALGGYLISKSGAVPMSFKIYDSSQTLVKSAESTGSVSQLNLIQFTFPKAGQYFIEVTGSSSVAMGLAVGKPGANPTYSATTPVFSGVVADIPTVGGFTQAQVDAKVTAARVGLFTQTEVTAQVTAAKVGLFTQVQLDAAVQLALHPIVPVPPTTAAFTNPLTLDKTDAANVVTLYKASATYTATVDNTEIKGNANANTLTASTKAIKISGGAGNDSITGSLLADTLTGDAGSDLINAGAGNDTVNGGTDADTLNGQEDADSMLGGSGNDTMSGGTENDIIKGEAGDDTLSGDAGDDVMSGDAGNDVMSGGEGVDSMLGGAGNDVLNGDAGNDTLLGEAGNDTLNGGEGDDVLTGAAGNDTLNGDAGADTLIGDAGTDVLNGGAGIDVLKGGTGNDTMNGGDDADVMTGGEGIDVMTGGAGEDTFVFNVKDSNIGKADTITDYAAGDIIKILAANNITMLGNYEPAIKGVAGVTLAKAAVNFPTANTAAFEIATGKLYINTDVDDVFEYSIQLTGVADASQITIESVPTMA